MIPQQNLTVEEDKTDKPVKQGVPFSQLGIISNLLLNLNKKGFEISTPIQHQVIPSAIQGKDIVGIAQTGTGKTFAFGIPMIQRIVFGKGQGLILAPTRELALQIEQALFSIGSVLGLRTSVIIGGVPQFKQVKSLKNDPHIIIATPGRLVDLMEQGNCRLDKIDTVVLDEADRMLDIGFMPQIKRILKTISKDRQTMLFSATMPQSIAMLTSEFMKLPLRIEIAPQGTLPENTEQEIFIVNRGDKMRLLDSLLQQYKTDTILIFSRTKFGAKRIARDIRNMGHTAVEIHSNRSQAQRKFAIDGFTNKQFRIMVATDIAARGIDVKHISVVINFDLPDNTEDYVHRIGRTGRAGRSGKAISFVTPAERYDITKIERLIKKRLPISNLPDLPADRPKVKEFNERPFEPRKRFSTNKSRDNNSRENKSRGGYSRNRNSSSSSRNRPKKSNFRRRDSR